MNVSLQDQLTSQFYAWERRGKGWSILPSPVELEPPFRPFSYVREVIPYIDDGKHPTIFSYIGDLLRNLAVPSPTFDEQVDSEDECFLFEDTSPIKVIRLSLPKGEKIRVAEIEQLFTMLSFSKLTISFEIVTTSELINFQMACRETDLRHIESQLKAYFPSCVLNIFDNDDVELLPDHTHLFGLNLGLQEEFMRPIKTVINFDLDPYTGLFGILEQIDEDVRVVIQILFKGTVNSWAESIIQSVSDSNGGSFFMDAPEMVPLAKEKVSSPLFGVVVRVVGSSNSPEQSEEIVDRVGQALTLLSTSQTNKLIPLPNEGYDAKHFFEDVLLRQSHRLGMLLNTKELSTLIHFPSPSIHSSKFKSEGRKTKRAPDFSVGHELVIGQNYHKGKETLASLSPSQRLKHMHVIGATGSGKSTFLLNLIMQDIEAKRGVAILNPHGDLIDEILHRIPKERMGDVVLIDPSDAQFPVGLNLLSAHSEIEKDILSSDLIAVFRRLSTSWGDQMNSVFANAIQAFVESKQNGTLLDLRRFLIEKEYREAFLKTVTDPSIVYYWKKEYPILKTSSIGPILTRLDTFLRPKLIRNMVIQERGINFNEVVNSHKIVLVKLSQGMIGTENSYLLGTMIVSKLARQEIDKNERNDFFLYIDEFQHFITPSMASILSGARKYHMGLVLAHQDMQQVVNSDPGVAASVLANAGTRVCFRLGETDAKKFESGFSAFESVDLQNLGTGEAIVKIERPEFDFSLSTLQLPEADFALASNIKQQIISTSRATYGTPREKVETSLHDLWGMQSVGGVRQIIKTSATHISKPEIVLSTQQEDFCEIKESIVENSVEAETKDLISKAEVSKHRYLQTLIKKMAESRGFKAVIEEPTPDGSGRIDVALVRNEYRIACEISVTSTDTWEVHNIEKCLAAGYDHIIVCSTDKRTLDKISKRVKENFDQSIQMRILTYTPEELFLFLDQQIADGLQKEERVKGYRVKVKYNAVSEDEAKAKKEGVLRTLTGSFKKMEKL